MNRVKEHVFLCTISECLSDEERTFLATEFLSETEHNKSLALTDEKKRDEFLQAHAFIKFILSQQLDVAPSSISFYTNAFGKPFISEEINRKKVFFNLSHSSGLTAIIIGNNESVGIDVERIIPRKDISSLEEIAFHDKELIAAKSITDTIDRVNNFYAKWVIKESILKAVGTGLSLDPKSLLITKDVKGIFKVRSQNVADANSLIINCKTFKNFAIAYTIRDSENLPGEVKTDFYNYSNFVFDQVQLD